MHRLIKLLIKVELISMLPKDHSEVLPLSEWTIIKSETN